MLAVVLAIVGSLAFAGWWRYFPHSSGDPGGKILNELQAVEHAVPPSAINVQWSGKDATWIGQCSDMYFDTGWSQIEGNVQFASTLSTHVLRLNVSTWMAAHGWTRTAMASAWTRGLPQGVMATASLSYVGPVGGAMSAGFIEASSPPTGSAGRCSGP